MARNKKRPQAPAAGHRRPCHDAARSGGHQGRQQHRAEDEHGHGGKPDLHEIHVDGLPAAGLVAQPGAQHQQAAVVVFEADDAQHRHHQAQHQQAPHGRGDLARQPPAPGGVDRNVLPHRMQAVRNHDPDQCEGEHRPAGPVDLGPAGGELQAQAAPARVAQPKSHGTAPDEGRQQRASQNEQARHQVLPRVGSDLVGHRDAEQHQEPHHHAPLLRGEFQRAPRHQRVAVEVLRRAPAGPRGVEAQRDDGEQHVDDPHPEILAALPGELQRMGFDLLRDEGRPRADAVGRWIDAHGSLFLEWRAVYSSVFALHPAVHGYRGGSWRRQGGRGGLARSAQSSCFLLRRARGWAASYTLARCWKSRRV